MRRAVSLSIAHSGKSDPPTPFEHSEFTNLDNITLISSISIAAFHRPSCSQRRFVLCFLFLQS